MLELKLVNFKGPNFCQSINSEQIFRHEKYENHCSLWSEKNHSWVSICCYKNRHGGTKVTEETSEKCRLLNPEWITSGPECKWEYLPFHIWPFITFLTWSVIGLLVMCVLQGLLQHWTNQSWSITPKENRKVPDFIYFINNQWNLV